MRSRDDLTRTLVELRRTNRTDAVRDADSATPALEAVSEQQKPATATTLTPLRRLATT